MNKPFCLPPVSRGSPRALLGFALCLATPASIAFAAEPLIRVSNLPTAQPDAPYPVSLHLDLAAALGPAARPDRLLLVDLARRKAARPSEVAVQFEPDVPGSLRGTISWLLPPGETGSRTLRLETSPAPGRVEMQARLNPATGRWDIFDAGKLVLGYNYQTNEPGDLLTKVHPNNLKYARPRSDYLHPLCGPDGEVLTKDWSVDHPHHRGIYWAWPEVDFRGSRGDLHALQQVFARPTGKCAGLSGPVFAQIDAENLWRWADQEPVVRERAIIRAWRAGPAGRWLDLEFRFTALKDDVAIARRETKLYGGLNIRLAAVQNQQIVFHTDPAETNPRRAWAELSGTFAGGKEPVGLAVFQKPTNPAYPGDWVKYPEINWFQPTFPAAGTRYVLKKDQTLVLQFRLWIRKH